MPTPLRCPTEASIRLPTLGGCLSVLLPQQRQTFGHRPCPRTQDALPAGRLPSAQSLRSSSTVSESSKDWQARLVLPWGWVRHPIDQSAARRPRDGLVAAGLGTTATAL